MTIRAVNELQLGEILGSVLSSIVDAQQQSSRATLDYIDEVGFSPEGDGERFRTVTFRYTKLDENQQPAEFTVEIPLLALVSIPSLSVKTAKVAFSYDVVESRSGDPAPSSEDRPRAISQFGAQPAVLKGHVTRRSTSDSAQATTSLDVDVTLEQQALPLGIERMFDLAELSISEQASTTGQTRAAVNRVAERPADVRYLGNRRTQEVHDLNNETANCQIATIVKQGNAVTFSPDTQDQANALTYDNCAYCLGGSSQ